MFIAEPPLTRHLSNAQLGDLRNAPLVNHTDAAERISKVLTEVAVSMFGCTELDVYRRAGANETPEQRSAGGH